MHDTGCLGLVHWDDPEGWYGEGGERRVQDREHMYILTQARRKAKRQGDLITILTPDVPLTPIPTGVAGPYLRTL